MLGEPSQSRADSSHISSKRAVVRVLTNLKTEFNELSMGHARSPIKSQLQIRSSGKKTPDFLIKSTTPSPVRVSSRPRFLVAKRGERAPLESEDSKYNWGKNLQIKAPVIKEDTASPNKASLFKLQTTRAKYKLLKEKYRELHSARDKEVTKLKEEISHLRAEKDNVAFMVGELTDKASGYKEEILNLVTLLKQITVSVSEPQPSPDFSSPLKEIVTSHLEGLSSRFPEFSLITQPIEAAESIPKDEEIIIGTAAFKTFSDYIEIQPSNSSANYYPEALALYNFKPQRAEDLSFTAGDRIMIIERREDGWWLGKLGDKVGVFPQNYVLLD